MTPVDLRAHAVVAPWQPALPETAAPVPARSSKAFREEIRKTALQAPARRGSERPGTLRARPDDLRVPAERPKSAGPAIRGMATTRDSGRAASRSGPVVDKRPGRNESWAASATNVRGPAPAPDSEARSLHPAEPATEDSALTMPGDSGHAPQETTGDAETTLEVTGREPLDPQLLALLAATIEVRTNGPVPEVAADRSPDPVASPGLIQASAQGTLLTPAPVGGVAAPQQQSVPRATTDTSPAGRATGLPTPGEAARSTAAASPDSIAGAAGRAAHGPAQAPEPERVAKTEVRREADALRVTSMPEMGLADLRLRPATGGQGDPHQEGGAEDAMPDAQADPLPMAERREGSFEGVVGSGAVGTREGVSNRTAREAPALTRTLAAEVQEAVRTGPRSIRMTLKPEALGEVQLRVALVGGGVRATLHVDREDARDLLGRQLDQVRQTLVDQGIRVDRLEVVWRGAETAEEQGRQDFGQGRHEREQQERDQPARRETEAWQQALNEAGQPADMSDIA
ncbi:MAG: flagellar hook-length control protein FliK [Candidatus Sericytochromatia bacterium]|nr:flagellar hook-length control protein FliK [Candidatus Tanganyikabacteria bacterium]